MVKQKSTLRPSDEKNALELHQCLQFIFPQAIVNSHESWRFIFTVVYLAKKNAYSRNCFCFSLRVGIFPKDFPKEIFNSESLWMLAFRITWIWIDHLAAYFIALGCPMSIANRTRSQVCSSLVLNPLIPGSWGVSFQRKLAWPKDQFSPQGR